MSVIPDRDLGTAALKRHDDGRIEVMQADDVIAISLDLLMSAHHPEIVVRGDGEVVEFCGYRYRATGDVTEWHGDPVYRQEARP